MTASTTNSLPFGARLREMGDRFNADFDQARVALGDALDAERRATDAERAGGSRSGAAVET